MGTKVEQRAASIARLLDSALHLFVSRGYGATNLEAIARAARLSKGSVLFYFGSKEAVLLELLKRVETVVVDAGLRAAAAAGPAPADQLVGFLHHQARLGVTHRDEVLLLILMSLEFGARDGDVRRHTSRIYRRLYAFVERQVRRGQAEGSLRTDLAPKEMASIVMANHDGTFLEWYRRAGTLAGPALVRALREVVLSGVSVANVRSAKITQSTRRRKP